MTQTRSAPSFRTWLLRHRREESAIGDVARDVADDPEWPRGPGSLDRYETHLLDVGAVPAAIEALRRAWQQYQDETLASWSSTSAPAAPSPQAPVENGDLTAAEVVQLGICTPSCLVAGSDEASKCSCRCGGTYHAVLADAEIAGTVRRAPWWQRYCDFTVAELDAYKPRGDWGSGAYWKAEKVAWDRARASRTAAIWVSKSDGGWRAECDQITMPWREDGQPWESQEGNPYQRLDFDAAAVALEFAREMLMTGHARATVVSEYSLMTGLASAVEAQAVCVVWADLLAGRMDRVLSCLMAVREDPRRGPLDPDDPADGGWAS